MSENEKKTQRQLAQTDELHQRTERRIMMILQMSMSGGLGVRAAAKEVAKRYNCEPEAVRIDWYNRHTWGQRFFNLHEPGAAIIDLLIELKGMKLSIDMEIRRLEPIKEPFVDEAGQPVRDTDGAIVYKPFNDRYARPRIQMKRLKLSIIALEQTIKTQLGFLPPMPDGAPYRWGRKGEQIERKSPEDMQKEFEKVKSQLDGLMNNDGWIDIKEVSDGE